MSFKWEGKGFMESLPRIYAIYTGGFLAFFALMAVLEQFGLSAKAIGILFVLFTLVVYAWAAWNLADHNGWRTPVRDSPWWMA